VCFLVEFSGNWTFGASIYQLKYDKEPLRGRLLNIPWVVSSSIFFRVCFTSLPWPCPYTCALGKIAAFQIVLDWLLYNNCALLFSTILKFTWVSFCSWWWVQFNNILNIFFGSPIIITFIVALVLDNTLLWHVSRKDRGLPWTRKFRSFGADARNLEFYSLPFGLHKIFPPNY
jgi:hypothetical protein